jgi:hypothetical protein
MSLHSTPENPFVAFPFGGHPTLAQYIDWIRQNGGSAESGISNLRGRIHSLMRITAANGNVAVVVDLKETEHLLPTMVGYLDRRLDVNSPWIGLNSDA